MEPERLIRAILLNMDGWIEAAKEIADTADNGACTRHRRLALHHQANLMQSKQALQRLMKEPEDDFRWLEDKDA